MVAMIPANRKTASDLFNILPRPVAIIIKECDMGGFTKECEKEK
jgi:hypothetical protein